MKRMLPVLIALALAVNLSACGYKGKLKSPSEIKAEEAKKAAKESRRKNEELSEEQNK